MSDAQQSGQEPVSILLVDDEENILRAIQRLLMDEEGIEIYTATSGEEGLDLLPGLANLGVIVSDQRMPGMGGAQFLEKARVINADASRIILTGYADVTAAVEAINKGGAWRYLAKPWNDDELVRIIHEGLERYRIIIENRRLNALVLKQNQELEEWNTGLKQRVLAQTTEIRKKNEELTLANSRLKGAFDGVIDSFAELINMRDKRYRRHGQNVSSLARHAAQQLHLPAEEVETIRVAGLLHDIGELGIPDAILQKEPNDMTPEEKLAYRSHPVRGQTAIDAVEQLRPAGLLIRHHHEQWDGKGFPDGLQGETIPLGARILAYADLIDRIVGNDPGENSMGRAMASVELEQRRSLDPSLLSVFRSIAKYTYALAEREETLNELEVKPINLYVGMKLARDVISGTGMLLLKQGEDLDEDRIASIRRYYRIDPPAHGVFVLVSG